MSDLFLLPVAMLASLRPHDDAYVTPIAPYTSAIECQADLADAREAYLPDFPGAVFWCAAPIGGFVLPDPSAAPDLADEPSQLAPDTSLRPRQRPTVEIDYD